MLRHTFRQIMLRSNLFQISAVVSRADWDDLVVPPYRQFLGTAEEACFLGFIEKSLGIVQEASVTDLKITFMYDVGRRTERFEQLIGIVEDQRFRPQVAGVSWGRVAELPALQAADIVATESYWAAQKWLAEGDLRATSAHFKRLLEGMAGHGLIVDREAIQASISRRGPDGRLLHTL